MSSLDTVKHARRRMLTTVLQRHLLSLAPSPKCLQQGFNFSEIRMVRDHRISRYCSVCPGLHCQHTMFLCNPSSFSLACDSPQYSGEAADI